MKPQYFGRINQHFINKLAEWNSEKLEQRKFFLMQIQLKVNANLNNNTLIKNLIINLYQKASSTS